MKILSGALVYILSQHNNEYSEEICTPYCELAFSYAYPKLLANSLGKYMVSVHIAIPKGLLLL